MKNIVTTIEEFEDAITGNGIDESVIRRNEQKLGIQFSNEYREYLENYGIAAANGHELTGICEIKRLNVADVTIYEKSKMASIPANCYVIEQTNIDGIVIWQSTSGEIFQTGPEKQTIKVCNSLQEYIKLF